MRCDFDAEQLEAVADRLGDSGLLAAGYDHLNVDVCWAQTRDASGGLRPDHARFPDGIPSLVGAVHRRWLKFGLYISAGVTTCQRNLQANGERLPIGSRGHEARDMADFAAWGVDYVKVDRRGQYETQDGRSSFESFRDAIRATGRAMILSTCEWALSRPWV